MNLLNIAVVESIPTIVASSLALGDIMPASQVTHVLNDPGKMIDRKSLTFLQRNEEVVLLVIKKKNKYIYYWRRGERARAEAEVLYYLPESFREASLSQNFERSRLVVG